MNTPRILVLLRPQYSFCRWGVSLCCFVGTILLASTSVLAAATTGNDTAGNLLANGSFEDSVYMPANSNTFNPLMDGWSGSGNFQVITNGLNYPDAYQGEKFLVFSAGETTPSGSIEQTVNVVSGPSYLLSFWLRHDGTDSNTRPGTVGIKAELLQNGSVLAATSVYLDTAAGYNIGQWYRFSLQAAANGPSITVRFTDISTRGALRKDISLDGISLTNSDADSDGDGLTDAWERGFGRYQVVQGSFTWEQAKADAESKGGHLATVTSADENAFISGMNTQLAWLGATDSSQEGLWQWVTGEGFNYSNWYIGYDGQEPDNYGGNQHYLITHFNGSDIWGDERVDDPNVAAYIFEFGYPTDPYNADSDGDGFNDSIETHYKTDPNNAAVTPNNSRPAGRVRAWGDSAFGECAVPPTLEGVIQVAAGSSDSIAVKLDGTIESWGAMLDQSLQHIPSYVPEGVANVVQIESGFDYKVALKGDGTVAVWGWLWDGYSHLAAPDASGLTGVVQVSAGASHYTVLKADGTVESRGSNNWGELNVPTGLSDVIQVSAGAYHSVALKRDGKVVVWGQFNHSSVYQVPESLNGVVKVAAGDHFTLALKSDGTVVAWGLNQFGQLSVPPSLTDVVDISASLVAGHALALKADGTVVAWGDNSLGQATVPENLIDVLSLAAGGGHSIALYTPAIDTDGDGIPDIYETTTGTWVSTTDTGTNPNNPDTDGDGLSDGAETVTGVYLSATDTGTDPNKADSDADGLADGIETATWIYLSPTDTGTDPNTWDTDWDGLADSAETNTGVYVGEGNTGTSPVNEDTSGDGIKDGEAVVWKFNPLIDQRSVVNFLKHTSENSAASRFGLYTSNSIADLNLGALLLQKSGNTVSLRLQLQSKSNMTNAWTNHSTIPIFLDMPGNRAFMRIRALGPQ
ncbi:MAG: hypothetical protein FGM15_04350 [Chthoniobacterales bacterium]|nr:hypothetical protein [Chthoniobacterales bacterium]